MAALLTRAFPWSLMLDDQHLQDASRVKTPRTWALALRDEPVLGSKFELQHFTTEMTHV